MSERHEAPPAGLRRIFARLFTGRRGGEVLEDLDRAYGAIRARQPRIVAWSWYVLQLLRPDSWRLAWLLRRVEGGVSDDPRGRSGFRLTGLSLDLKLGWRMLAKSPGLTVVGMLGIALGTAVGVGFFVVLSTHLYPVLPLEEGDRVVAIQNWNVETSEVVRPSVQDFLGWRGELGALEQVSAATLGERALATGSAAPRSVRAAEMTAGGFQVARVQPLIGRYLHPDDERDDALRVAVLGHELWQAQYAGDPGVIGRSVLVGSLPHTVVGVMPPGFAFPKNQELWTALRARGGSQAGEEAELFVFARLAAGATPEQAQAELAAIGGRAETRLPESNRHLRPQVVPFTHPLDSITIGTLWSAARIQLMVSLLLAAIAVNVAVLVYARTASRRGEIALRVALGAGRRRIVGQLFVEALLLSALGTALGVVVAQLALHQFEAFIGRLDGVGFWVDYRLQPASVAFALVLAVLSAVVIGVMPALKFIGRRLDTDLRPAVSGGAGLGRAWTALIVAQVAVAIAVLPSALHLGMREVTIGSVRATFPAHEFLSANVGVAMPLAADMDAAAHRRATSARLADRLSELERRLESDPAVTGATFEARLPGRDQLLEIEGIPGPAESGAHRVGSNGVALDYFELVGARILAGRGLGPQDVGEAGAGVVVNDAFVRRVLGGSAAHGVRVRFVPGQSLERRQPPAPGPWLEVVGVVEDLQASTFDREWAPPRVYYAVAPHQLQSARLLVRVRGDPAGFTARLRQTTTTLDPDLRLGAVGNLDALEYPEYFALAVTSIVLALGTVLLLSAAGIHALMSLIVTRRRKEIAIRTALGARAARVMAGIFSRAGRQLGLGGVLGAALGAALLLGNGLAVREAAVFVGGVALLMLTVGLGAALGPARRGLGIQPVEALKEE